jgi:hypothetical protein
MMIDRITPEDIDSNLTEVVLIDFHDVRNNLGPKHLIIKNTEADTVIIRYHYADALMEYPVQKSLDTDTENIVAGNTTKHIILEGSWFVEQIKVTAILQNAFVAGAKVEGKLLGPMPDGIGESGTHRTD